MSTIQVTFRVALFVLIIAIGYAISEMLAGTEQERKKPSPTDHKKEVAIALAKYDTHNISISGTGRIVSKSTINLIARANERVIAGDYPLREGTHFKKGDHLFSVYSKKFELELSAQKASLLSSLASVLPDIEIDFQESYSEWRDFFDAIMPDKKLPPLPHLTDKLKVFLSGRNIINTYYRIQAQEITLSQYHVYAPFDGTYSRVYAMEGSYVMTGTPVAEAMKTTQLEVETQIPKTDLSFIKRGMQATIYGDKKEEAWKARVIRISPFINPETQTQTVYLNVNLNTKKPLLKQGEYLTVEFNDIQLFNAIEIPRNVIFNSTQIFVVEDGILKKTEVDIIKKSATNAWIRGLAPKTSIVVEVITGTKEGSEVNTYSVDDF